MPSNYPDDIRSYDEDPRSPFYDNLLERAEEAAREALPEALMGQVGRLGLTLTVEAQHDADEDGRYVSVTYRLDGHTFDADLAEDLAEDLARLDVEHPDFDAALMEVLR